MQENRLKVKTLLSFSPNKLKENVYRVRARAGGKLAHLPPFEIREMLVDSNLATSVSPRKNKLSAGKLFRNARQIASEDTFLPDKANRLSNTNESSTPQDSVGRQVRLQRPLACARHDRSMSNQGRERDGKVIQRTVSIVIDGKHEESRGKEVMDTLSRIILGEDHSDDLFLEFLQESSIHGEQENFLEVDSRFLEEIIHNDQEYVPSA